MGFYRDCFDNFLSGSTKVAGKRPVSLPGSIMPPACFALLGSAAGGLEGCARLQVQAASPHDVSGTSMLKMLQNLSLQETGNQ